MRVRTTTIPMLAALVIALAIGLAAPSAAGAADDAPRVDINTASAEQLTALPGVGPALAKRIVEFRDEHGPFKRAEDLMKVRGIGEKSFDKIKARVTVGSAR